MRRQKSKSTASLHLKLRALGHAHFFYTSVEASVMLWVQATWYIPKPCRQQALPGGSPSFSWGSPVDDC